MSDGSVGLTIGVEELIYMGEHLQICPMASCVTHGVAGVSTFQTCSSSLASKGAISTIPARDSARYDL